eukprot:m.111380 g.111380  ORF g.111380 m.111380 type:complete len:236 (-) comp28117_c0_seq2:122-829(-)
MAMTAVRTLFWVGRRPYIQCTPILEISVPCIKKIPSTTGQRQCFATVTPSLTVSPIVKAQMTLPTLQQTRSSSSSSGSGSGSPSKRNQVPSKYPCTLTDFEWRAALSPLEYDVLRDKGTEPARSGEYDDFTAPSGHFACRGCAAPLYSAQSKFESGCGWPAFDKCYTGSVVTKTDLAYGMVRIEIMCANCGGHLGHVFRGERYTESNQRHCVNSLSITFKATNPEVASDETDLDL